MSLVDSHSSTVTRLNVASAATLSSLLSFPPGSPASVVRYANIVAMFGAIIPYGMVFHLFYSGRISDREVSVGLGWSTLWLVLFTAVTALLPLVIGNRSLRRREY